MENIKNGDMNWIIPNKLLAFPGPNATKSNYGLYSHIPEDYVEYFKRNNIKTVIRLNEDK